MKKFEGILICTDLDGTLLRNDKTISKENKEAIEYFKSEGGRFTFVTGRVPSAALPIYNMVQPNAPIGCFNGAGVYDYETDTFVHFNELPEESLVLTEMIDRALPDVGIQLNTATNVYFCKDNPAQQDFRTNTGLPHKVCPYTNREEPVGKMIFLHRDVERLQKAAELLTSHPLAEKFNFIRSEKTIYEILPKGATKGAAISHIARGCGVDISRTIAVGDYDNDVSMLESARVGIAVSNASEAAKNAADLVLSVSNEEHAIAKIIWDLDAGKIRI
jgi:Cof subfamily protein (haloacid dehalogenase superfamily)